MKKFLASARSYVQTKTVTLTAIALFTASLGNRNEWWTVDSADVETGFALFLGLIVSGTVTSNARLNGGKVWAGVAGILHGKELEPVESDDDDV